MSCRLGSLVILVSAQSWSCTIIAGKKLRTVYQIENKIVFRGGGDGRQIATLGLGKRVRRVPSQAVESWDCQVGVAIAAGGNIPSDPARVSGGAKEAGTEDRTPKCLVIFCDRLFFIGVLLFLVWFLVYGC